VADAPLKQISRRATSRQGAPPKTSFREAPGGTLLAGYVYGEFGFTNWLKCTPTDSASRCGL
jgi:hypothetical protein